MPQLLIIADREGERQIGIERGLRLAAKAGWQADVVAFSHEYLGAAGIEGRANQDAAKRALLERRRAEVEAQVSDLAPRGVDCQVLPVWQKHIHNWIEKQCAKVDYEAVVKTGHRSGAFHYTSTDWHLIRNCSAPVMIVAQSKWRKTKPIIAAVDLASRSRVKRALNEKIITTAKHYAQLLDCELHVLHAIQISAVLTELDLVDEHTRGLQMREELTPVVEKLERKSGLRAGTVATKRGPADKVITSEAARLKAQLVVMGTVGRKGVRARLLGNSAERVLETLRTDVLTIKP